MCPSSYTINEGLVIPLEVYLTGKMDASGYELLSKYKYLQLRIM